MKPYNFAANFSSTVFCSSAGRFSHDEWHLRLAFFPISFTACLNSLAGFSSSTATARRRRQQPVASIECETHAPEPFLAWWRPPHQSRIGWLSGGLLTSMTGASSGNVGKTLYATIGKSHKSDDWQLPDIQMNTVGQISSENSFYRAIGGRLVDGSKLESVLPFDGSWRLVP